MCGCNVVVSNKLYHPVVSLQCRRHVPTPTAPWSALVRYSLPIGIPKRDPGVWAHIGRPCGCTGMWVLYGPRLSNLKAHVVCMWLCCLKYTVREAPVVALRHSAENVVISRLSSCPPYVCVGNKRSSTSHYPMGLHCMLQGVTKKNTKLCGLSPWSNYTDRATAACQRS
jgi:hypothetical protein